MNSNIISEREKYALHLREVEKMTYNKIAEKLCVSAVRAAQIYSNAYRKREQHETCPNEWFYGLNTRTVNCLFNGDIKSYEEAVNAIKENRLGPGKIKYYGKKTHDELCLFLGINNTEK